LDKKGNIKKVIVNEKNVNVNAIFISTNGKYILKALFYDYDSGGGAILYDNMEG